ncbi:MAG: serine/threonine protein kinase [Ignavibacteriales bacterium]|nr:serine/threonine protein kinase [Ignavibacteriales bacterium]
MNSNYNEIIKSIFERALELDRLSREIFFNNLKEEEKPYEEEVKSLLQAFEKHNDFLEIETDLNIFSEDKIGPHPLIGQHIGSYLIDEEIGIGGMGIVFKGKRDDKEFEQKVAIKILKQGLSTEYLVKRFQNERQTLANLQHPNIARLFDGGKTSEGLPYLIMEFIDGMPITEYCDKNNLSIDQRLKLFITVCNAVQYAHQNLVIHRDIKPGNILVNNEGRPKLLDFGVSKLLDNENSEKHEDLTKTGMWHLTPEFASPEQIKGENITTASDIYSLGVLLYQILSGSAPYKIYNASPLAISKILDEEKITKPSEIALKNTKEINKEELENKLLPNYKELKGDIDNIVLKAMHKDPNQRYSSVQEFSNDIDRYLKGLPVIARPDTYGYRFSKFVQRHKVGVALFVLVNIIILSSIAAVIYQGRIAAKERDKAKIENQKYEKVNGFLTSILSSVDPSEIGRDVKVYDVLDKAAEDVETNFKEHPEVEASIRSTLGNTYVNLGEYDKGKPFLEKAYKINLDKYGKESKEIAASIHDLANYYDWIGEYKKADSLYSQSINIFRKVLDKPSKMFADALNNHGIVLMNFGKYEEAENLYLEAIDISKKVEGKKSKNLASIYNNLAYSYTDEGKLDKAEIYYKQSLRILLEILGKNRPEVGTAYNNLGWLYTQLEKFDSAEVYLQKSYELKYELKGKDHPDVGLALNNLGVIKTRKGEYLEAENYFYEAIEQYKKSYPSDHPLISTSYAGLGRVYFSLGKFVKSEEYFRKSLEIKIKKLPADHWEIFKTKGELGIVLIKENKLNEAEKLLTKSYEYYYQNQSDDKKSQEDFLKALIELYDKKNNPELSEKYQALLNNL